MDKVKVGISCGDINGIGMEVIIKALEDPRILNHSTPIIYGSSKVLSYHKNIVNPEGFKIYNIKSTDQVQEDRINVLNCWNETINIRLGEITKESGTYAALALEQATQDAVAGKIDCLVTAPINKKAMSLAGFQYVGHTEYLKHMCNSEEVLMMMCSEDMKVALATGHVPIQNVSSALSSDKIYNKTELLINTLKRDFGMEKPKIAVLGIQPHAGDEGTIGMEDEEITKPAIEKLKNSGYLVYGPYASDGFFGQLDHRKFDAVMACYHDQGLIPFKTLTFGHGVNFTAGLNKVRTSPDHGTAYDIAGQGIARTDSFKEALFAGIEIFKTRTMNLELHDNPLQPGRKKQIHKK